MSTDTRNETLRRWAAAEGAMARRAERLAVLRAAGRGAGRSERGYAQRLAVRLYPDAGSEYRRHETVAGDLLVGLRQPQYRVRLDA